jgi:hypothetical protein
MAVGVSPCEGTFSPASSDESTDGNQWPQYEEGHKAKMDQSPIAVDALQESFCIGTTYSSSVGVEAPLSAPSMELALLEPDQLDFLIPSLHSRHIDDSVSMLIISSSNVIVDCNSAFLQQAGLLDTTQLKGQFPNAAALFGSSTDLILACLGHLRTRGMGSMVIDASVSLTKGLSWHQLTFTLLPGPMQSVTVAWDSNTSILPPVSGVTCQVFSSTAVQEH